MIEDDLLERAQRTLKLLHERALAPGQINGDEIPLLMQGVALCLELQNDLTIELGRMSRRLDRLTARELDE